MTLIESIKRCIGKKYFSTEGRAPLSEYWWFALYNVLGAFIVSSIGFAIKENIGGTLIAIWVIFHLSPNICVFVRRLHDGDHSGWNILWGLLGGIGAIIHLILVLDSGTKGVNKYGSPYPYDEDDIKLTPYQFAQIKAQLNQAWQEKYGTPYPNPNATSIPNEHMAVWSEWQEKQNQQPIQEEQTQISNENTLYSQQHPSKSSAGYGNEICPTCGTQIHNSDATYCWRCGRFINNQSS